MRFLSVCSGIEAASAAWHGLGWTPVAYSDIDKFASALLAERYPDVPNLGDMTRFDEWPQLLLDALVGGTPCQSFSVAGQRRSLKDERGNLTLVFCRIADRFDPELIVWENVPGVLSTPDNAFGCFLAELTGCDTPIDPGGVGWTHAGVVAGPKRTAAWRVIDSQGFVPQRRARVFVVCTRAGSRVHPADVLFETEAEAFGCLGERAYTGPLFPLATGVRGDSQAGDEAGQEAAGALGAGSKRSGGRVGRREAAAGQLVAHALSGRHNASHRDDSDTCVAQALRADGHDASEDGTSRGTPLIAFRPSARGGFVKGVGTLMRGGGGSIGQGGDETLLVFDTTQITSPESRSNPQPGDPCHPLAHGAHVPAIAFDARQSDVIQYGEKSGPLDSDGSSVAVMTLASRGRDGGHNLEIRSDETANAVLTPSGGGRCGMGVGAVAVPPSMVVRRLTPTECERLMSFPDGYTLITYRGKPAADGPRYKALGNSMVVQVVHWIGERIARLAA